MSEFIIRVYYEAIEQAIELIVPLLRKSFEGKGNEPQMQLVRANWGKTRGMNSVDTLLKLTSPDVFVTAVVGAGASAREIPLVAVEFSEAVKTEDHELQRAIGAIAALESRMVFVKISGEKRSPYAHGGNTKFDPHVIAKILEDTRGFGGYFYQPWPSDESGLERQTKALSCPPLEKVGLLDAVLGAVGLLVHNEALSRYSADQIYAKLIKLIDGQPAVVAYRARVRAAQADSGSMVMRVLNPTPTRVDPIRMIARRVEVSSEGTLHIKINRFDHSADPDRGGLITLSSVWKGRVLCLYQIERKGKTLSKRRLKSAYGKAKSVIDAFPAYARIEGMQPWFSEAIQSCSRVLREVDITKVVLAHRAEWESNKVLRALFCYSDGILAQLKKKGKVTWVALTWSRIAPHSQPKRTTGTSRQVIEQLPMAVQSATEPNEDEVTYVLINRVLWPNGFKVLNVSYPGHQGGGAILSQKESGRTRSRLYADVVAVVPGGKVIPSLTESKAVLSRGSDRDIAKLVGIRTDKGRKSGLATFLKAQNIHGWDGKQVVLSVAFGDAKGTRWEPRSIDFLVRLKGRKVFEVAPFGEARRFFKVVAGATLLPEIFEQVKT